MATDAGDSHDELKIGENQENGANDPESSFEAQAEAAGMTGIPFRC